MGLGIALGGAVKGLESAERAKLGQDSLALRRDQFEADNSLAQQRVGIAQRRLAMDEAANAQARIDALTEDAIKAAGVVLESGGTVEAKRSLVRQIMGPIVEVNPNAAQKMQQLEAMTALPSGDAPSMGDLKAGAMNKFLKGEQLSPQEQKLVDKELTTDSFADLVRSMAGPDEGSTAAPPALPDSLKGKGAKWSPSKQRFFLPDGTSFNAQGVPVS